MKERVWVPGHCVDNPVLLGLGIKNRVDGHYEERVIQPERTETRVVKPERTECGVVQRGFYRTVIDRPARTEVTYRKVWVPRHFE